MMPFTYQHISVHITHAHNLHLMIPMQTQMFVAKKSTQKSKLTENNSQYTRTHLHPNNSLHDDDDDDANGYKSINISIYTA